MTTARSCAEITALLPDVLEDVIEPDLRRSIDGHLAGCSECAREMRALRRTRALLRSVPPLRLGDERRTRLLAEFRKQTRKSPARIALHDTAPADAASPPPRQLSLHRNGRPDPDA